MNTSCEERIDQSLGGTLTDLRRLWKDYQRGEDEEGIHEYGLSLDYVAPGTFEEQDEGYLRYQLSWGGPSTEFRIYFSPGASRPYRVEYWYLNWFDGASRTMRGEDFEFLTELFDWWNSMGMVDQALEDALD